MRPPIDSATILVTGACSGLGKELARQLAPRARTLVLVAQHMEPLEALAEELQGHNPTLGVLLEQCNLSDTGEVERLLGWLEQHLVRVDVLVHEAGVGPRGLFEEEGWGPLERLLRANVVAPVLLAHRLVRRMVERRRGGLLHITPGWEPLVSPGLSVASASQRFLEGFSESLRQELAEAGVTVTQVVSSPVAGEPGEAPGQGRGLWQWLQVPLEQCAREALEGFERGEARVYPGHGWLLRLLPWVPLPVQRAVGRLVAHRLRQRAPLLEIPTGRALPSGA